MQIKYSDNLNKLSFPIKTINNNVNIHINDAKIDILENVEIIKNEYKIYIDYVVDADIFTDKNMNIIINYNYVKKWSLTTNLIDGKKLSVILSDVCGQIKNNGQYEIKQMIKKIIHKIRKNNYNIDVFFSRSPCHIIDIDYIGNQEIDDLVISYETLTHDSK